MSSMLSCTELIMFDLFLTKPHMFYMLQKDASKMSRKLNRSWTGLEQVLNMRLKMAVVTNQQHGFDGNPMTLWLFLVLTGGILQFVFKLGFIRSRFCMIKIYHV